MRADNNVECCKDGENVKERDRKEEKKIVGGNGSPHGWMVKALLGRGSVNLAQAHSTLLKKLVSSIKSWKIYE